MPPESESKEGSWGFRSFLLFVAVLIIAFIGWLVWAMVEFTPTVERDIAKSLLASPLFQRGDFAVTNQPSRCRTGDELKGKISAGLYQSFQTANNTDSGNLQLHRFQKELQVLDESRTPSQWFREIKRPVMAISNVGVYDTQALVCLELYAASSRGMFVTLEHAGADYWRMIANEQTWEDIDEKPEEIPELAIPSVD
ncbi:MAG: hypothetical protein OXG25_07185 [Gammaproteobacteria bacterium]|nr:hypothetical protein [Gammaproteobacteria bacterium]